MIKKLCIASLFIFCASAYCEIGGLAGNFYLSTKYQISLMSSAVGGNVEFSYVGPGRFGGFAGIDFGGGGKVLDNKEYETDIFPRTVTKGGDIGGGASFGVKIQPIDWFTAVLGGSGGCWAFIKSYNTFTIHDSTEFTYDDTEFAGGGVFLKLLFGGKKIRYELSSRILFGRMDSPVTQIATGVTFIPGKKDK